MLRTLSIVTVLVLLGAGTVVYGQNAQVRGQVADSAGAVIPRAIVHLADRQTGTERTTETNGAGQYAAAGLAPGLYKISVEAPGFQTAVSDAVTLHVGQDAVLDFRLKVGDASSEVVVNGDSVKIDTVDGSVSSVIDRQFVEDIPLNGRSFQTLVLLSPGITTPSSEGNDDGQFSVNGQRTDANYYLVDGVGVNNGASWYSGANTSGMSASATALGTTQAILPVDALQEFRILTSSYSAEYGRQPGAQISLLSRSGTTQYHGDAYDYLRNVVFDANDWFNTYNTPVIARPAERQNDFGGAIGGPVMLPKIMPGSDKLLFFAAYEGLRLQLPQAPTVLYVPSNGTYNTGTYANALYKNLRQNTKPALQPVYNAFPLPNCTTAQNPQCIDYGDGLSPYLRTGSLPSRLDTYYLRADSQLTPWLHVFARYSDSTSNAQSYYYRGPDLDTVTDRIRVFFLGADAVFRQSIVNQLRLQYSPSFYVADYSTSYQDGAQAVNLNTLQGLPPVGGESIIIFEPPSGETGYLYQLHFGSRQFQPNGVDTVSWTRGRHAFKSGVDYRQTTSYLADGQRQLSRAPGGFYYFETSAQMLANTTDEAEVFESKRQNLITKNIGVFTQDQWRVRPRFTLSLGLRWDVDPVPTITGAQQYTYQGNINNPTSMSLAPLGTPIYQTSYTGVQPRAGAAVVLHNQPGKETVLRGGIGLFHGTIALPEVVGGDESLGAANEQVLKGVSFPVTSNVILEPYPAIIAPYSLGYVANPHLVPPTTIHWNVSLEQGIGQRQTFILGYVGSQGRNLINWTEHNISSINPSFNSFTEFDNGPGSSYNALQLQFKRQPFHGLQATASYTWSHVIDSQSTDYALLPTQRGNSSHDVRNNFSGALVYNVNAHLQNRTERLLASHWSLSLFAVARSAFPVQVSGTDTLDPITGEEYPTRLNYTGANPYVYKHGIPGGRQFNPAVFSVPTASQNGEGNAPRNFLRGFGEFAADAAVQRTFDLHARLALLFRAEAFNVTNHPNFGAVSATCGTNIAGAVCNSPMMGQATKTLSNALGGAAGGNPESIYQQGGPRSMQFAMKLQF